MAHGHAHAHGRGNHNGSEASAVKFIVAIFLNIVITVAEYIGGILSGSLALISDAGHNFSDVLSLILGYAGERVSQIKTGRLYSFGLKRFEVLIALVNALSLLAIGIWIVYEAAERYINPVPIKPGIMLWIAVIGLAGNIISMLILMPGRSRSINVRSAFLHLLYDAVASVAVIVTAAVMMFTQMAILDLVISVGIVLMIAYSSIDIIREAMRIFLQGTPRGIDPDEVARKIEELPSVASVHGMHIWSVSSREVFLSCHICVDSSEGAVDTDAVIKEVNHILDDEYGITHTTIQMEQNMVCMTANDHECCR